MIRIGINTLAWSTPIGRFGNKKKLPTGQLLFLTSVTVPEISASVPASSNCAASTRIEESEFFFLPTPFSFHLRLLKRSYSLFSLSLSFSTTLGQWGEIGGIFFALFTRFTKVGVYSIFLFFVKSLLIACKWLLEWYSRQVWKDSKKCANISKTTIRMSFTWVKSKLGICMV